MAVADIDGDGFADLIIGSYGWDPPGTSQYGKTGRIYVYSGSSSGLSAEPTYKWPSDAPAEELIGAKIGYDITAMGDVNGDGIEDIAVAAQGYGRYGWQGAPCSSSSAARADCLRSPL